VKVSCLIFGKLDGVIGDPDCTKECYLESEIAEAFPTD
jgi:hypothetical protein